MMSLEAILFLLVTYGGANLLSANFLSPYLAHTGGLLWVYLLSLGGWVVFLWLGSQTSAKSQRQQFWWTTLVCLTIFSGMFIRQLNFRGHDQVPRGIHDGAVHTEVAAEMLWRGSNPYTADYQRSEYGALNPLIQGGPAVNVVWSHYIYPPLGFLMQAPLSWAEKILGLRPDVRWLYAAALLLASGLIVWSTSDWKSRTRLVLLTLGNPLVWIFTAVGYNEVLAAALVVGAAVAGQKKRWLLAGLSFGLALGVKQNIWVMLLLWLWWVWRQSKHDQRIWRAATLGTLIAVGAVFLPFLIWNGAALYDDIIRYASGSIPYSYPVSGSSFLQYLHIFGAIDSPWSVFPTYVFQLAVGIPILLISGRWLTHRPTASQWLTSSAVVMLTIMLFSRYFNSNYTTTIILLAVAALALDDHESSRS